MKKIIAKTILIVVFIVCLIGFSFSAYKLISARNLYKQADAEIKQLQQLCPNITSTNDFPVFGVNADISNLKSQNKDAVGWLEIEGTSINYPFVLGKDNDEYLRRSFYKDSYLVSGTIFMDYRCKGDFSDFNSILYGHKMKNGTMFGGLDRFEQADYFKSHNFAKLVLEDATYSCHTLAYMVVKSDDKFVFDNRVDRDAYLEYIKENAINYSDMDIGEYDTLLTLSTCNYSFEQARSVLIMKIKKI